MTLTVKPRLARTNRRSTAKNAVTRSSLEAEIADFELSYLECANQISAMNDTLKVLGEEVKQTKSAISQKHGQLRTRQTRRKIICNERDLAYMRKESSEAAMNQLYEKYVSIRRRNDDLIKKYCPTEGEWHDQLVAEISQASAAWRERREEFQANKDLLNALRDQINDIDVDISKLDDDLYQLRRELRRQNIIIDEKKAELRDAIENQENNKVAILARNYRLAELENLPTTDYCLEQLASQLNLPCDNLNVKFSPGDVCQIYFGECDGKHGHCVISGNGYTKYRRMPCESHGSHNYL